jgi:hypothetical protein
MDDGAVIKKIFYLTENDFKQFLSSIKFTYMYYGTSGPLSVAL